MRILSFFLRIFPITLFVITVFYLGDGGSLLPSVVLAAVHEAAHLLTLSAIGGRGSFRPTLGGFRISQSRPISYMRELCVILSGPAANLTLCIIFYYIGANALLVQSLALGLFNLLPVSTLDGGRALFIMLSSLLSPDRAFFISEAISAFTVFLIVFVSLYLVFRTGGGFYLLFLSFLCLYRHFSVSNGKINQN